MKKIIGWSLIILGIIMVLGTIYSTYLNFTGQSEFPQIFTFEEEKVTPQTAEGLEDQIGGMIREYIKEILPQDTTTQMLNMFAWIMFAVFLVYSGSKLVSMGGTLLKTPKKEKE
jgi:hypothetical protein